MVDVIGSSPLVESIALGFVLVVAVALISAAVLGHLGERDKKRFESDMRRRYSE